MEWVLSQTQCIRPIQVRDRDKVASLVTSSLAEFGFFFDEVRGLNGEFEVLNADPRAGFWALFVNEMLVGCIAIRPSEGTSCELKRFYVAAEMRGQGLGGALYDHAESFARAAGYTTLWLESSRRFVGAATFYRQRGFQLLRDVDNDWEDSIYSKELAHLRNGRFIEGV